ncbi:MULTISPECIES: hypothetical protein [Streptomyces]|uniref:hypothetical protein n=1 Tax=Streptomyces TaxID=1883 RepID=UPI00343A6D89
MIRSQLRLLCAVVVPTLVLTACSGSPADQRPAHPVFDAPVGQQPRQALLETQDSRSARFTQTLTFGSPSGDTVQRSVGRVDFAEGRAAGSIEWSLAPDLPEPAKDALLGVRLGPGHAPARTRIAVDRDSVRLRAGEAGYWLTYGGTLEAFGGEASVNALRGSESAFGGTLLEIVSGAQDVEHAEDAEGGRTYEAKLTAYNALRMFSRDLQAELTSNIDPSGTDTPVTLGLAVDADGHITRAEADFTELLDRKDSALAEMTGLHAVMTLNKQGDSPPVMPAPSEPTLDAKTAVRAVGDLKRGSCADLATGNRTVDMVVAVPCTQPHDVRVFAHARLGTEYPGDDMAQRKAGEACRRDHLAAPREWRRESADEDEYWYTWPEEDGWGVGGAATASCYIVTRDPVTTTTVAA